MSVQPVPAGYHTITPYLIVRGATAALEFYQKAFGAVQTLRLADPTGRICHAEMKLGDSTIMLADEMPEMRFNSPLAIGGSPVCLLIYLPDVDARFQRAVAAGAKSLRPVTDQFYGDRAGTLEDPFGHLWTLSTHIEDVSAKEIQKRFEEAMKQHQAK